MRLSEFKKIVSSLEDLNFQLTDGTSVPSHYHVTEIGNISKDFIDCGGTIRNERVVNFQLWYSIDFDHRLKPKKMLDIIELSERKLGIEDAEIEVEYQADTIGKFGLDFDGKNFVLTNKQTACLAMDNCGIPTEKIKVSLAALGKKTENCCSPESGCC